jgi:hypothetical protein
MLFLAVRFIEGLRGTSFPESTITVEVYFGLVKLISSDELFGLKYPGLINMS